MDNNEQLAVVEAQNAGAMALSAIGQEIKKFEMQQRMANMYAASTIVPDTYRNNVGNCVIAIDMAQRMGANPLMVMQNLYIVYGNPAWSSKFLISCINQSKRFAPIQYEFSGERGTDSWACKVFTFAATDTERKEKLIGPEVSIAIAKAEGWYGKSGSKWKTMPELMLRYRAAAFWQRTFCPEISMGFLTVEEAYDIQDVPYEEVHELPKARIAARAKERALADAAPADAKPTEGGNEVDDAQPIVNEDFLKPTEPAEK